MLSPAATATLSTPVASVGSGRSAARLVPYGLAAPAAVLLFTFVLAPLLLVIGVAFTDWQLGKPAAAFVGLANFRTLLDDPDFRQSLRVTACYAAMVVPTTVAGGLVLAQMIAASGRAAPFYRAIYFLPVVTTLAAMAVIWQVLLSPPVGLVYRLLVAIGFDAPNLLRDPDLALPTLALVGIWSEIGFAILFFLAGLKTIRAEYYEAAALDGCGGLWDRFWLVTWPQLAPVTLFISVVSTVHALRTFDTVAVMTRGGPEHATQLLLFTIYQEAFQLFRTNFAAAATVVFVLIVTALSLLQLVAGRGRRAS